MNETVFLILVIVGIVANSIALLVAAKILFAYDKISEMQTEYFKKVVEISLDALSKMAVIAGLKRDK
ncbi:MAG: hypothetical protein K2J77_13055 [Oscillospiraceae bacterium]|nr:hypothetical protein [Oscillospiraceae bacterium]